MDLSGIAYGKTELWDSVAHMQLVAAIEGAFRLTLDSEDVISMSTYVAVRRVLREHHDITIDP